MLPGTSRNTDALGFLLFFFSRSLLLCLALDKVLEGKGDEDPPKTIDGGGDANEAGAVNRPDASTSFRASMFSAGIAISSYRGRFESFRRFDGAGGVVVLPPADPKEEERGCCDDDGGDEPASAGGVNRSDASTVFRASRFKSGKAMSSKAAGPDDADDEPIESPLCGPGGRC